MRRDPKIPTFRPPGGRNFRAFAAAGIPTDSALEAIEHAARGVRLREHRQHPRRRRIDEDRRWAMPVIRSRPRLPIGEPEGALRKARNLLWRGNPRKVMCITDRRWSELDAALARVAQGVYPDAAAERHLLQILKDLPPDRAWRVSHIVVRYQDVQFQRSQPSPE